MEIGILIVILIATTVSYITRWLSTEVTSLLAIASLALSGILTVDEALSGFASTATLTVAAMFVLSGGLLRTGALEAVTIRLASLSQGSPTRLLLLLGITVPVASAFMNNTPVVVMMMPVILSLSARFQIRPSKLLIPLSYFAVLGGSMTLLGTSTNILIDDLYRKAGGPGFALFTFTPLGLIYMVVGVAFIVLFSQRLLPNRTPLADMVSSRRAATYITELTVDEQSDLAGRRVTSLFSQIQAAPPSTLRQVHRHRRLHPPNTANASSVDADEGESALQLLELFRNEHIYRSDETESLILQMGDTLLISGTPKEIALFLENHSSAPNPAAEAARQAGADRLELQVVEAVVLPDSDFNGRVIPELELSRFEQVSVMGLQRQGRQQRTGLRDVRLQPGDVLLLRGKPQTLRVLGEQGNLLLVEGVEHSMVRGAKNRISLLIMAGVIGLASLTSIPIVMLALTGAALMMATRCLRINEAVRSLNPATLLLLAATIPLGRAMELTGLAQLIVDQLVLVVHFASPLLFLSLFYLFTGMLTEIISNNAVAVLMTPIALNLSLTLGISPTPLLMAIAFGASASFMTPMGYQTNAIVMGPGGYNFADYLRMGAPIQIILWLTASFVIPILWPL